MEVLHGGRKLQEQGLDFGRKKRLLHVLLEGLEIVLKEIHDKENTGLEDQLPHLYEGKCVKVLTRPCCRPLLPRANSQH